MKKNKGDSSGTLFKQEKKKVVAHNFYGSSLSRSDRCLMCQTKSGLFISYFFKSKCQSTRGIYDSKSYFIRKNLIFPKTYHNIFLLIITFLFGTRREMNTRNRHHHKLTLIFQCDHFSLFAIFETERKMRAIVY